MANRFGSETTADEVLAGVDLTGRLALVTGASTGLGLETARALGAAGACVVVMARTHEKATAAIDALRASVPRAELEPGVVDLASTASIRASAASFLDRHEELHLLVNNAGVMYTPFERTIDGFELQFGTNHLGHFLLTNLLLPTLLAGAPSRIVNLSSGGHRSSDIHWDDPNYERRDYDKFESYGQSKTANVLFSVELDRRLAGRGVHSYSVHPGMIRTDLSRYMTRDDLKELMARAARGPSGGLPGFKSIGAGAATTVWAATAPELADYGGAYLADCGVSTEVAPWAVDAASAARLWALSEQLVGQEFTVG
ncbi:MAG TPA: SDR family NAD(P)-dependent oxidoreductase [Acidimicrobiales bacterium]|nr:SDR family NAD(P)-dependent oxidoreductase [Acidimicrobiales bacterium]